MVCFGLRMVRTASDANPMPSCTPRWSRCETAAAIVAGQQIDYVALIPSQPMHRRLRLFIRRLHADALAQCIFQCDRSVMLQRDPERLVANSCMTACCRGKPVRRVPFRRRDALRRMGEWFSGQCPPILRQKQ